MLFRSLDRFLTSFGYTENQSTGLELIDVPPAGTTGTSGTSRRAGVLPEYSLALTVAHPSMRRNDAVFGLKRAPDQIWVEICTVDGRMIRRLNIDIRNRGQVVVYWNGTDSTGKLVGTGNYVVRLWAGSETISRQLRLVA